MAPSARQRRTPRKESKSSSKTRGFKGVSTSKTPVYILNNLLRSRSFWVVIVALVTVTAITFYGLLSSLNSALRDTTEKLFGPSSEYLNPPFEIVDLPGKGKGVVALRDIRQGELLFREKPLFRVPRQTQESPTGLISEALSKLDNEQLKNFYSLSYIKPDGESDTSEGLEAQIPLAIFQTNAVSAGESVGLFPRMARLNHGCSSAFTAVYSWREDEGEIVVHAIKPVKKGEEILTTYTNTKRPREERREFLSQLYDFNCTCAVCSLPGPLSRASDKRLMQITELLQRMASWGHAQIEGEEAVEIIRNIWDTGNEEGYWSERGRLAADAVWVAAAHSDATAVREWATLAARWYGYELGIDSEYVKEMRGVASKPDSHQAWGSRDVMVVGGPGERL